MIDDRGPIFVGGLERTGTSLIYALLASHPSIAMTRRTNWWTFFYRQFGPLTEDDNLDRCLALMARYRRHRKLEPDFSQLRAEFVAGERTYERLFALLQEQHARRLGKPRWGDKSLHTERYAEVIFRAYPGARILHMVRDPRDRYASALRRWRRDRGGPGVAAAMWRASLELGERHARHHPGQYLLLSYDRLVSDPERILRELCEFIGEPYAPEMLQMEGAAAFRDAGGNSSYGNVRHTSISMASVGRYREVLSPSQVAFIQTWAGGAMRRQGYAIDEVRLPAPRRLRYLALELPLNLGRLAAWHLREAYRDRSGRRPSEHTILSDGEPI